MNAARAARHLLAELTPDMLVSLKLLLVQSIFRRDCTAPGISTTVYKWCEKVSKSSARGMCATFFALLTMDYERDRLWRKAGPPLLVGKLVQIPRAATR